VAELERQLAEARTAAAAPVEETEDQRIQRLVAAGIAAAMPAAVASHVERNGVARKGLIESQGAYGVPGGVIQETSPVGAPEGLPASWPQKPLHLYTETERAAFLRPAMEAHVMGVRSVQYRADATS
jgi:hypothetical protein